MIAAIHSDSPLHEFGIPEQSCSGFPLFFVFPSSYAIVSPGPVFLVYRSAEDDPEKPLWVLPGRRTVGSQVCCYFYCSLIKGLRANGGGGGAH